MDPQVQSFLDPAAIITILVASRNYIVPDSYKNRYVTIPILSMAIHLSAHFGKLLTGQLDSKLLSDNHNFGGFESLSSANAPKHLNLIRYKNMATTTRDRKSTKTIEAINTEALAEYSTDNYHEKLYGTVYYTISEYSTKGPLGPSSFPSTALARSSVWYSTERLVQPIVVSRFRFL